MLSLQDIEKAMSVQPYKWVGIDFPEDRTRFTLCFESQQETEKAVCPYCGSPVHICGTYSMRLKDMPLYVKQPLEFDVSYHRYRCTECSKSFNEDIPFKYSNARITERAAHWINSLLQFNISISTVQQLTGIHWDTIKKIQQDLMLETIDVRRRALKRQGYKPKHLAVDEFAIHKGHKYATCVMDLDEGDVIWVGKGRTKADFFKFFIETDLDYLSEVEAIAMDMNASYNILVKEYMPDVEIVYDRYHMQAQFGREVLGVVRLNEARRHNAEAKRLRDEENNKKEAKIEKALYSEVKRARWLLLSNSSSLTGEDVVRLNKILDDHSTLSLCYAMKEEMCELFNITDEDEARKRWRSWFDGAKASEIPALVKFAEQKEKRIDGLIAHAKHPISTGKLEGFNNRIKVAKRIAYGYRDEEYFFTLIRYISIPWIRSKYPKKT